MIRPTVKATIRHNNPVELTGKTLARFARQLTGSVRRRQGLLGPECLITSSEVIASSARTSEESDGKVEDWLR